MFRQFEKIVVGTAIVLSASVLLPIAKSTLQPLAAMGIEGVRRLSDQTRTLIGTAKEGIEDIYAEAQFERLKRQLDKEIGGE